jgi:hypothetical protein
VSGGRVTTGNVYSGQSGSAGYIRGQSGGAARVGNDLYASHDGSVYRNTGGGWQQNSGGGWGNVSESTRNQALDREQQARSSGETRVDNFRAGGGWGGFHGGGFRGRRR